MSFRGKKKTKKEKQKHQRWRGESGPNHVMCRVQISSVGLFGMAL